MKMKHCLWTALVAIIVLLYRPVYAAGGSPCCVPARSDLGLTLCAEYQSFQYQFDLVYVPDSSGLFWKMDPSTFRRISNDGGGCIPVETDLALRLACVNYLNNNYAFTLNYTVYPPDPTGMYWKLDGSTLVVTPAGSQDPLFPFQWHLYNVGQKTFSQSGGTYGEDLHMRQAVADGLTGQGVVVAVIDSGLEIAHEDIASNVMPNGSYNYINQTTDPTPTCTDGDHGTCVSGIIGAVAMNGKGGRGVAPRASLKAFNPLGTQREQDKIASMGMGPRSADGDVFNMSYALDGTYYIGLSTTMADAYEASHALRGGKGGIYIKSAGNEFEDFEDEHGQEYICSKQEYGIEGLCCENAVAQEEKSRPEIILAGAFNASGIKSSYSSSGSNLWISTPGGEEGRYLPAILTVDQSGCDKGDSRKDLEDPANPFEVGDPTYNPECNYTSAFGGTSSAAPNASGAIALMLEVNPNLRRRDVKHILAKTARKIDSLSPTSIVMVDINGASYLASQGWITNGGGYHFHDWYGFGALDVDAAMAMARSYTAGSLPKLMDRSYGQDTFPEPLAIPDNDATGLTSTIDVPDDLTVESLLVMVSIDHPDTGEVGIEIVSPHGTRSILLNIRSALRTGLNKERGALMASNAFYGETAKGTWTLRVVDSWKNTVGTLDYFKLRILGY